MIIEEIYEKLEDGKFRYLILFKHCNKNKQNYSSLLGIDNRLSIDEILKKYRGKHKLLVYRDKYNHLQTIVRTFKFTQIYKVS